jgi:hypothetical protein
MLLAVTQIYAALWTTEERIYLRNRVIRTWKTQAEKTKEKSKESEVTKWFREAGLPWFTNIRWLAIRIILLIIGVLYFAIFSSITNLMLFIIIIQYLTEPLFKYSGIRLFLKWRTQYIQEKKETELFTLFALLKTDLLSSPHEQVNAYYLLSESLPYFQYINGTLIKFLKMWRQSPEKAAKVFEEDLGGETAEFLSDVLSRLHNMNRMDAISLLSEQSQVLGYKRSEFAMRKAEVQRNVYYAFFIVSSFVGIFWFMWFIYSMTTTQMNF